MKERSIGIQTEPHLELKVKALSLSAEAVIIRRLERKLAKARSAWNRSQNVHVRDKFLSLQHHRKQVVRPEARATHLARMFLKGLDYLQVENKCNEAPNWKKVLELILRYGPSAPGWDKRDANQRFEEWRQTCQPTSFVAKTPSQSSPS